MPKGKLKGWKGICSNAGKFVHADEGMKYVFGRVGIMLVNPNAPEADALLELVDWYFSGNWIEVYEEDDDEVL